MILRALPGFARQTIRDAIWTAGTDAGNLLSGHSENLTLYNGYVGWAAATVRQFQSLLRPAEIERLVLTPRHQALLLTQYPAAEPTADMVRLELEQRCSDLEDVRRSLDHLSLRWPDPDAKFLLIDTSFLTRYPTEIESLDLSPVGLESASVHLLLPMVVIDELDRLKERAPEFTHKRRSWRALTYLDKVLDVPTDVVFLRKADKAAGTGYVTLEVLFDPPGHLRLPNEDDEIVDRGVAVQTIADRRVSILTFDTGQSTRARAAGLGAIKLNIPEPQDKNKKARSDQPKL